MCIRDRDSNKDLLIELIDNDDSSSLSQLSCEDLLEVKMLPSQAVQHKDKDILVRSSPESRRSYHMELMDVFGLVHQSQHKRPSVAVNVSTNRRPLSRSFHSPRTKTTSPVPTEIVINSNFSFHDENQPMPHLMRRRKSRISRLDGFSTPRIAPKSLIQRISPRQISQSSVPDYVIQGLVWIHSPGCPKAHLELDIQQQQVTSRAVYLRQNTLLRLAWSLNKFFTL